MAPSPAGAPGRYDLSGVADCNEADVPAVSSRNGKVTFVEDSPASRRHLRGEEIVSEDRDNGTRQLILLDLRVRLRARKSVRLCSSTVYDCSFQGFN